MGNKFLYHIAKAKLVNKTRTKATVTHRTWSANPGNNWYSLVANIVDQVLFKRDVWKFSGYYLAKKMTSRNHVYNRAFQATIIHTSTHICTSEVESNHGPILNNLK